MPVDREDVAIRIFQKRVAGCFGHRRLSEYYFSAEVCRTVDAVVDGDNANVVNPAALNKIFVSIGDVT